MVAVTYKMSNSEGVVYLPCTTSSVAKSKAKTLYKKGMLNVKVVDVKEEVLFVPSVDECKEC